MAASDLSTWLDNAKQMHCTGTVGFTKTNEITEAGFIKDEKWSPTIWNVMEKKNLGKKAGDKENSDN